jgi:hypothetical protein
MVSKSVRRVAAVISSAALALVFAGSPAHAQCQNGQSGGHGGSPGGGQNRQGGGPGGQMGMGRPGAGQMGPGGGGMGRRGGGMTAGQSMQRGQMSQSNGGQQAAMIAALQKQQVTAMQFAVQQQQAALRTSLEQIASKIYAVEQTDDSERAQIRLYWLRQRQVVLQNALQQSTGSQRPAVMRSSTY